MALEVLALGTTRRNSNNEEVQKDLIEKLLRFSGRLESVSSNALNHISSLALSSHCHNDHIDDLDVFDHLG